MEWQLNISLCSSLIRCAAFINYSTVTYFKNERDACEQCDVKEINGKTVQVIFISPKV